MSRPRTFDHAEAVARIAAGESYSDVAERNGVSKSSISWLARRHGIVRRSMRDGYRCNQRLLTALGIDGRDPVRSAREAAVSARLRVLRAQVRLGGALLCGPLQVAAAHAAGLTLDDIHEVFAVPLAEAVRAIAAHAGR